MPKIRHEYHANYTVIDNTVIRDTRLSYKARGIFLYLWHLPDTWEISLADLQRHSAPDGDSSIRSGIRELNTLGYVRYQRIRKSGKIVDTLWTLCDKPSVENPHAAIPPLENLPPLKYDKEVSTMEVSMGERDDRDATLSPPPLLSYRCPDSWECPETLRLWAETTYAWINVEEALAQFRDHEFTRAVQDWNAVARSWIRRYAGYQKQDGTATARPQLKGAAYEQAVEKEFAKLQAEKKVYR